MTTLLSIDPSSTCTGYAVFRNKRLVDAGLLKPTNRKDPPTKRIVEMVAELQGVLHEKKPKVAVVEITSGKVNTRRHGGSGAGLAIYGMAVGAMWQSLREYLVWGKIEGEVVCVPENDWIRHRAKGQKSKAARIAEVAACHKKYDPDKDKGGDAADAILLGEWYLNSEMNND